MHGTAARVAESEAGVERMKVRKQRREIRDLKSEVRRQSQTVSTVASEIVAV